MIFLLTGKEIVLRSVKFPPSIYEQKSNESIGFPRQNQEDPRHRESKDKDAISEIIGNVGDRSQRVENLIDTAEKEIENVLRRFND